jgi:hypothetical protein
MSDGDKAPTSPSYCHPWASGVTHWLSEAMAGVVPLRPGFESFVAMPHISGHTLSTVGGTQPTPQGAITVSASRENERGTVAVEVESPVSGFAGLRLVGPRPLSLRINPYRSSLSIAPLQTDRQTDRQIVLYFSNTAQLRKESHPP